MTMNDKEIFNYLSEEFQKEFNKTPSHVEFVNYLGSKFQGICKLIKDIETEVAENGAWSRDEELRHKAAVENLRSHLAAARSRCQHWKTEYHPGSGNNDSYKECTICGEHL